VPTESSTTAIKLHFSVSRTVLFGTNRARVLASASLLNNKGEGSVDASLRASRNKLTEIPSGTPSSRAAVGDFSDIISRGT